MTTQTTKPAGRKLSEQTDPLDLPENRWRWPPAVCIAGIMLFLLLQMLVPFNPDPYWDMDPRSDVFSGTTRYITEITSTGMVYMNLLVIALCFVGLLAHKLAGGPLRAWVLVPVALGSLAGLWIAVNADEAVRVLGWVAAAMSAAAVWHLAQTPRERGMIVWSLMGICILLAIRSGLYAFVEFPATLKSLMDNRDALFQARGWAPDSSQAQAYIRRASQMEAGGAYGLSNVFGSVTAALAFLAAGITIAAYRTAGVRRAGFPAVATLAALACLALSFSKGAAVGAVGVACFALLATAICRWAPGRPRWVIPGLALAVLASGFLLVIFRGAIIGPPATIEGERSLLFRHHYWTATVNMLSQMSPAEWVTGLSPDGFRSLYPKLKVPINPEEVSSNHNYWIDYIIMLGAGGLAWSLLLTGFMLRSVSKAFGPSSPNPSIQQTPDEQVHDTPADHVDRVSVRVGGVLALALFFGVYVYQKPMLLPESLIALMIGAGAVAVAIGTGATPLWITNKNQGPVRIGLALAGLMLLFHGQIEMTFFSSGAVMTGWVVLAAAAADWKPWATPQSLVGPQKAAPETHPPGDNPTPALPGSAGWLAMLPALAVVIASAGWFVIRGMPILQQQQLLAQSAEVFPRDFTGGIDLLAKAVRAYPANPRAARNVIDYCGEAAEIMKNAGNKTAALTWIEFAQKTTQAVPEQLLDTTFLLRPMSRLRFIEYQISNDPAALAESILLMKRARELSPFDRTMTEDLGMLYEAGGDKKSALEAYETALRQSDLAYLDETRVMTDRQRQAVEEKISRLKESPKRVE